MSLVTGHLAVRTHSVTFSYTPHETTSRSVVILQAMKESLDTKLSCIARR
jgi:hypothetical protein